MCKKRKRRNSEDPMRVPSTVLRTSCSVTARLPDRLNDKLAGSLSKNGACTTHSVFHLTIQSLLLPGFQLRNWRVIITAIVAYRRQAVSLMRLNLPLESLSPY